MEWKRNSQDSWHLARSNARGADFQERKKYNKDEDNYFEGTSVQKNKKMRRPRVSEGRPSAVPQGFSVAEPSPAPQVNAWAKKKGSELFQKEEEVDEEDQVMKLVLEESLKSVEEDNKRRMERLRMANRDLQASSSKTMPAERDWEEEYETEDYNVKHSLGGNKDYTPKPDLVFVDTDDVEEDSNQNQRHRSIPPRNRNTSPQEKSTPHFKNKKFDYPESVSKVPSAVNKTRSSGENEASSTRVNKEPDDNCFEPPHRQGRDSKPVDKGNEITSSSPQATHSSSTLVNSSFNQANFNADNLATSFNSTLTFGDTQGLLEKIQGDDSLKIRGNIPGFRTETPSTGSSETKPVNPASEPSETDILLHNFIRHEPPTNTISLDQSDVLGMTAVDKSEPNDLFALQTSQAYSQNITSAQGSLPQQMVSSEQLSAVNSLVGISLPGGVQVPNGRDASSSVSGSPLQNITPYGSLENQIHSSVNTGGQAASLLGNVPYQYPSYTIENQESLARHLQAMQLINQNLTSPMNREYSAIPTAVRGMMPVHSQGQPQIRLTNSNMMIPPYQGMSPMLLQHHLQQAQLQQAQLQQAHLQQMQIPPGYLPHVMADATQLQQSQNSPDAAESDNDEDDATDEQVNVNHPRTQNHNQMVTQNQTQIPQNQVQIPQNQSQIPQAQSQVPLHNLQAQAQISIHNPQAQAGLQTQMLPQAPYGQIFSQTQAQLLLQAQAQMLSQNNAQMLSQTNAQMLSQNQQLFHLQNHPQPGTEMSTPKQEELLQQQAMLGRTQGVKTAEELHQQKMKALQVLMQTEEEIQRQNALSQTTLPTAQPQPGWGMIPQSPQMPLSVNQFFPVGMVPQVHPHLMQQTQNASVMPQTVQPTVQNQINAGLMNTGSESFPAQEPAQPAVGRGRGRIL